MERSRSAATAGRLFYLKPGEQAMLRHQSAFTSTHIISGIPQQHTAKIVFQLKCAAAFCYLWKSTLLPFQLNQVNNIIRPIVAADLNSIKNILDSSELFPFELLDDMIAPYFTEPGSGEIWFTYAQENIPVGLGYCVPEKLTDGTYNLLAIAVDKKQQGKGIGSAMLAYIENHLKEQQKRILIVETSSDDQFAQTRNFYKKAGYTIAGTIKDFWKEGDDKVIFLKKL